MLIGYLEHLDLGLKLVATFAGAVVTALVAGISFHEFSHAFVADRLGDRTARMQGRVSLNPLRHLDPTGSVLFVLAGFGWGKPVPVNPLRLRHGPLTGRAMVAAAGPLSNLLLAFIASIPLYFGLVEWRDPFRIPFQIDSWGVEEYVGLYLTAVIFFNIILAVFNLLPIAPLDGFSVAVGLLPRDLSMSLARLEQYGPMILMGLFVLPFVTNGQVNILRDAMWPVVSSLTNLITGGRGVA